MSELSDLKVTFFTAMVTGRNLPDDHNLDCPQVADNWPVVAGNEGHRI